jgi:hypothetical protein
MNGKIFPSFFHFPFPLEIFLKGELSFDIWLKESKLFSLTSKPYKYIVERGLEYWQEIMDITIPFADNILR